MSRDDETQFYLDLLRGYLDSAGDAIFVLCDEMKFLLCNKIAEQWFGHSEAQLTRHNARTPVTDLLGDSRCVQRFSEAFEKALTLNLPQRFECHINNEYTRSFWAEFSINRVAMDAGTMVIVVGRDTTAHRRTLGEMQKLYHAIEQTADIVVISDREGTIEYVNPAFESITGYSAEDVIGRKTGFLKSGQHDDDFYRDLWQTILSGHPFNELFINRKKDGSLYYEQKTITPLTDDGGSVTHFIATGKDVTDRIYDQHRIDILSYYDPLTGLANRRLLLDRLEHAIVRAQRENHIVVVLLLDLDRFKTVNDILEPEAGDSLIKGIAGRLINCVREDDSVARVGSDEFAVVLEGGDPTGRCRQRGQNDPFCHQSAFRA